MSLPIIEQLEAQHTARHQQEETEKLMRANGHSRSEIEATIAAGPQARPTAGGATAKERNNPKNYTPGQTILGGGVTPGTKKADEEAGSEGLEGKLTRLTEPAREGSEKAGETLAEVAKAKVNLPNPLSWTEAIAKVFSKLAEGAFWVRVLKFVLGAGLLVIAIFLFARGAGLGAETPVTAATQQASKAVTGAATGQRTRQTSVSAGARQRVAAGVKRETERDDTERGKSGKPLAGNALTERRRARVRQRAKALPSTRELRRGAKR